MKLLDKIIVENEDIEEKVKLLLRMYDRQERQELYRELHYFFKKYSSYIDSDRRQIYKEIAELIHRNYKISSIRYKIRIRLISEIQRNAIAQGNFQLYKKFFTKEEQKVLGYLDVVEAIKKEMF